MFCTEDGSEALQYLLLEGAGNNLLGDVDNVGDLRVPSLLKVEGVGVGHISSSDTLRRSIEVEEGVGLGESSDDLSANTMSSPSLLDGHETTSLLDGSSDSVDIERADGTEVDDLSVDTLSSELLSGLKSSVETLGVGDDGDIGTLAHDLGLADGDEEIRAVELLTNSEGSTIHELGLEADNGVIITNSGLEETLGILSIIRSNDLETGDGAIPSSKALRVLSSDSGSSTVATTENDGDVHLTTRHVAGLSSRVDDVINGLEREVEGHELANGTKTTHGSTNGETSETHLSNRGVDHTLGTILLPETLGNLVGTIVLSDLLTEKENSLITS